MRDFYLGLLLKKRPAAVDLFVEGVRGPLRGE